MFALWRNKTIIWHLLCPMKAENLVDGENLTEYEINKLQHEKCFLRYLRPRCFCIRKLTRLLRSLVLLLRCQQLARKYRGAPLSWSSLYILISLVKISIILLKCTEIRCCMIETSSGLPLKYSAIFVDLRKFSENVRQRSSDLRTGFGKSSEIFNRITTFLCIRHVSILRTSPSVKKKIKNRTT